MRGNLQNWESVFFLVPIMGGSDTVVSNGTSSRQVLLFPTTVQFWTIEDFLFHDNCIST